MVNCVIQPCGILKPLVCHAKPTCSTRNFFNCITNPGIGVVKSGYREDFLRIPCPPLKHGFSDCQVCGDGSIKPPGHITGVDLCLESSVACIYCCHCLFFKYPSLCLLWRWLYRQFICLIVIEMEMIKIYRISCILSFNFMVHIRTSNSQALCLLTSAPAKCHICIKSLNLIFMKHVIFLVPQDIDTVSNHLVFNQVLVAQRVKPCDLQLIFRFIWGMSEIGLTIEIDHCPECPLRCAVKRSASFALYPVLPANHPHTITNAVF
ncbi:hypothetical protein MBAV_003163 [Candidatus Magnetobacterium bavaricum]|uniref:Uncharacterized protein n=1 Tax=Candidatus Magnetobacterium bavaricum TaxID=29290 RepID=A0A0F3GVD1_9BACT|nr:hypothetical protein MBAV_003163 [Candidatus Magnetobacterium bavaricum]